MPTEPSREAVDAMATRMRELDPGFNPEYDAARDLIHELLVAALLIERQRWEQEVRERLSKYLKLRISEREALASRREIEPWQEQAEQLKASIFREVLSDIDSIFGEAEPVEGQAERVAETMGVCPKCGSTVCGHGMEHVSPAEFERMHKGESSPDPDAAEGEGRR